jgi:hypothetical protein
VVIIKLTFFDETKIYEAKKAQDFLLCLYKYQASAMVGLVFTTNTGNPTIHREPNFGICM